MNARFESRIAANLEAMPESRGWRQIISQTYSQGTNNALGGRFPLHAEKMKTRIHYGEDLGGSSGGGRSEAQAETAGIPSLHPPFDSLLPAILDRAFNGGL